MNIKKIKVNNYGNLQNREIILEDKINIIYGKNESGKSTLVNYIKNMLYGISKTKDGKEISDYEKYIPWVGEEFSGKIEYELDDNTKYEIFRDFNKGKVQIVDGFGENITDTFNIDKNRNNDFFIDQTKLNKDLFETTFMSAQLEVKIDKQKQSQIVQKISNMVETGEEVTSYKRAIDKINKRQNDEIGSGKTRGKPINIIQDKIEECKYKLNEIKNSNFLNLETTSEKTEIEKNIIFFEAEQKALDDFKNILEQAKIHNQKIESNEEVQSVNNAQIKIEKEKLERTVNSGNYSDEEEVKISYNKYVVSGISAIIIAIVIYFTMKNIFVSGAFLIVSMLITFINCIREKDVISKRKESQNNHEQNIKIIRSKIQVLQNNNFELQKVIQELDVNYEMKINEEIESWKNKFIGELGIEELNFILDKIDIENIDNKIISVQNKLNEIRIQHTKDSYQKEVNDVKIKEKITLEEDLIKYEKYKSKLLYEYNIMEEVKLLLGNAYEEMKKQVTPFLIEEISKHIASISGGSYTNIKLSDKDGMVVEGIQGEYVPMSRFSVGTIDQLYLALRLATINQITDESVPLFFDETFVYFDDTRLANLMSHINREYPGRQVFIFTCTSREKNILSSLGINYSFVEI